MSIDDDDDDDDDDGGDVEAKKLKKSKTPTVDKKLPEASWLQPTDDGMESISDTDSLAAPTIQWGRPPSDDEGDLEEGMVSKTSAVSWLEPGDDDDELCHIPEPPCKSPPAKIARHSWNRPGF